MTTQVTTTGITFNDTTVQTTAATATFIKTASPTIPLMEVKTTIGTSTWTIPAGVTRVRVTVTGGGGGGNGNYGPSGGAGGTAIKVFDNVTPGTTMTYTVGAGASGFGASRTGGTSSVVYSGVTVSASGGTPPNTTYPGYAGLGGTATGGDINLVGGGGSVGGSDPNVDLRNGASGGNSFWGAGAPGMWNTGNSGTASYGQNYGGGGASTGTDGGGGSGGQGVVVFEY